MDENKQPEKQDQAPLTAKKKRALLEYLAILCAGAFLIVALSLGIKLAAVQNDLEAADLGARENIAALQDNLEQEQKKVKALEEELSSAQTSAALTQDALKQAQSENDTLNKANAALEAEKKAAESRAEATQLLLEAYMAYQSGNSTEFREKMQALSTCASALDESVRAQYEALAAKLS